MQELQELADVFGKEGRLAACLSKFQPRAGQQAMAEAVAELLYAFPNTETTEPFEAGARVLVVEAETGIGKTLAYLVPAVLSGQRVVISTATLNLQDQIINKDIPLVEKIFDQKVPALCIKGRENYLCHYKWFQYCSNPQLSLIDDPWIEKIDSWFKKTTTGDRAELDWLSKKSGLWSRISSTTKDCLGGDCPEAASCFVNRLRKNAGSARLLIVNHHLFFSDLALRKSGYGELLPRYESVIFDEAHHLENVASTFFGKTFSQYQLVDLLGDIERQALLDLPPEEVDALLPHLSTFKMRLGSFAGIFPNKRGRFFLQDLIDERGVNVWRDEVEQLSGELTGLLDLLKKYLPFGEGWTVLRSRAGELSDKFSDIALFQDGDSNTFVHWYEKRERAVILSATPIEVAEELRSNLYCAVSSCVLTSATLTSGGSFSYIQERLGLDDAANYLQFNSPFDYANRTLLYVPENDFPEPSSPQFLSDVAERVQQILKLSQGRALVLCTSLRGMDSLAESLESVVDFPVLVQGRGSRNSLLKSFREETHSVLLAVASFWEGVDVVGDSLSCLIIEKLPFEVPSDPVIKARIERINDEGGKPFFEFQVPRAILTLRQGVGRLMRSVTDRGVIGIMDVRLFKKGYGRVFLRSLPPSPVTRSVADIEIFYSASERD